MAERTGSYPFMNIADDFGLPYGNVLLFASCRSMRDEERSTHQKNAVWRVYGALDIDNIAAFDARVSDARRRDRPTVGAGWSVADAVAGNGEEAVGEDVLAMSDEDLLRVSLSWFGLRAPVSGDELAFGWGWQRHVRRLLRAIVEHVRKPRGTEAATPDTGSGLREALEKIDQEATSAASRADAGYTINVATLMSIYTTARQARAALSDTTEATPEVTSHG